MSYRKRLSFLILIDSFIVLTAVYISNFFLNASVKAMPIQALLISSIVLLISHHLFSWIYKLYKKAWEYASVSELLAIFKAVTLSISLTGIMQLIIFQNIFIRTLIITWMIHIILIGGSRFSWRMFRDSIIRTNHNRKRTLIIGAGSAGAMVARQLLQNQDAELAPIAFIDDDVRKQQLEMMGLPVLGGIEKIEKAVQDLKIENIVIAIPSLNQKELNVIFNECAKTDAKTKILPMIEDLMDGKVSVSQFREVEVEDLLGREPIKLDNKGIAESITGKTVLVTGAGGSIGSEICRQVFAFLPEKIILLGHGENSIYTIEMELREYMKERIELITEIADVQDKERMLQVMKKYQPDVVYHAAAHKHVPLMERNPQEAVKNNIVGTKNTAEAASAAGVKTFVMVSTDKAVNPTSVMGATKRLAEMIVQHMDTVSKTRFVAVRFGNVLGSRGSVIPLFKKQIQKGGPVTVTHPDMIRYFMTIPEASRLVIQAGALAKGGEIFVLDMGEPVKIVELAKNLIKLSGYTIEEIGIEYSGIRPGEKMYEELLGKDEVHEQQVYPKIYIGRSIDLDINEIIHLTTEHERLDKEEVSRMVLGIAHGENKKILVANAK